MASATSNLSEKVSPAQVVLGLLLIMVLIGVAYYFLMFTEKDDEIQQINTQINQVNLRLAELEDTRQNLVAIQKKADEVEQRLERLQARLPSSSEDLDEFLADISQRRQNARIEKWLNYSPSQPVARGEVDEIPIQMKFVATYDAATEFFWELSKMGEGIETGGKEQFVNVTDVRMSRNDSNKGLVNVSCVVRTYLYKGQQPQQQKKRRRR